jgi:replicative DNA helicase
MEPNENSKIARFPGVEEPHLRLPPENLEAEQALLGSILINNAAYHRVSDFLRPEHFANALHGQLFGALSRLIEKGQVVSVITLKTYLEQDEAMKAAGGSAFLAGLAAASVHVIDAAQFGRVVHDLYLRRQLIALGHDVVNGAFKPTIEESAIEQIETAEKQLYDLASIGQIEGGFKPFHASLTEAVTAAESAHKRIGKLTGIATGLTRLDQTLGGLHKSDLIILAGRPSMGKSSLATNIGFNAAKAWREEHDELGKSQTADGAIVGFFSLEMSAEQLATRMLSEQAGVPSEKIRRGELLSTDFDRVLSVSRELEHLNFYIDDTPALSIAALRTRARRLKRMHGLDLIIIDYLQLLAPSGKSRQENRVQEVSEITRGLKTLAKELNVPVLALSQLSRAVEQREDKRPQLADLRESGSIEQDADVVMFIYREEYYLSRTTPTQGEHESDEKFGNRLERIKERGEQAAGKAEVIVAKQRHGPTGVVHLKFEGSITKFDNLPSEDDRSDVPTF